MGETKFLVKVKRMPPGDKLSWLLATPAPRAPGPHRVEIARAAATALSPALPNHEAEILRP